ncbi:MAG: hypothetical protein LUB59_00370 [Candidatus Gastranaerophilales bacterium]|nr:hypothetical protein [Candidatus Gastranaerophilales bacterium]
MNAGLLGVSVIYGKLFVFRKKEAMFVSDYCAGVALCLGLYVIMSFLYVGLMPDVFSKSVMLFFAFSPFILGLSANYNTEKYFTALQILFIASSIAYLV